MTSEFPPTLNICKLLYYIYIKTYIYFHVVFFIFIFHFNTQSQGRKAEVGFQISPSLKLQGQFCEAKTGPHLLLVSI